MALQGKQRELVTIAWFHLGVTVTELAQYLHTKFSFIVNAIYECHV